MSNKHFLEILEKSKAIHSKKAADYTTDVEVNPHENFTRASEIASWFPNEYSAHSALIGTKLARLGALLSSKKEAQNEPIDDTFLDLLTYVGLMYSYYKDRQRNQEKVEYVGPGELCFHNQVDVITSCCLNCGLALPILVTTNLLRYKVSNLNKNVLIRKV